MGNKLKERPISPAKLVASRPSGGLSVGVSITAAIVLVTIYYWPLIRAHLGL